MLCEICEQPVLSLFSDEVFCSIKCRGIAAQRIKILCQNCGKPRWLQPSEVGIIKSCSAACRQYVRKRINVICEFCGKLFEITPGRLKHGRGKHCSPKCQYAAIEARPQKDAVELTCEGCGITFSRQKCYLEKSKGAGKYCTRPCRDRHRTGKQHPQFVHGKRDTYRGFNWQAQKRKTRKRDDYTCQHCQMTQEQSLVKFGQSLAVHHIKPYRWFGDDYLSANQLDNLVTLCHSCHRKADAETRRQEHAASICAS